MPKIQRAYRRSQRKQQVLKQLRIWHENGYATEATSYKLAGALGMRSSPHFRSILNEMVEEGDLYRVFRDQPGRMGTFFYLLVESHLIAEKFSRRHIRVNKRGVNVGQLEMFQ